MNLSAGEKAAFDLLLDFVVKAEVFNDTVYCIDEPELHMHTKLQANLLDEMYNLISERCQLWIATHSIGMTRRAMEMHRNNPEQVVFLDFEGRNFDASVTIEPAVVDRQFWKHVFTGALDDLAELIAPSQVVFCEGKREGGLGETSTTFDADIYRQVFRRTHPVTEFIPLGGSNDVEKDSLLISGVFNRLFSSISVWRVLDKDDRNDDEVQELRIKGTLVLRRRDVESYLWDDEILIRLCDSQQKPEAVSDILAFKATLLKELQASLMPTNDVKSISGRLYVDIRKRLGLYGQGNTANAFCKAVLAPLITPDTAVYKELESDVFGDR